MIEWNVFVKAVEYDIKIINYVNKVNFFNQ